MTASAGESTAEERAREVIGDWIQASSDGSMGCVPTSEFRDLERCLVAALQAHAAAAERQRDRAQQKYEEYRDIWFMRGFPTKDGEPDLDGTVVGLNSANLVLQSRLDSAEALARRLAGRLRISSRLYHSREHAQDWSACTVLTCENIRALLASHEVTALGPVQPVNVFNK